MALSPIYCSFIRFNTGGSTCKHDGYKAAVRLNAHGRTSEYTVAPNASSHSWDLENTCSSKMHNQNSIYPFDRGIYQPFISHCSPSSVSKGPASVRRFPARDGAPRTRGD